MNTKETPPEHDEDLYPELTDADIAAIRKASPATNTPISKFTRSLFPLSRDEKVDG